MQDGVLNGMTDKLPGEADLAIQRAQAIPDEKNRAIALKGLQPYLDAIRIIDVIIGAIANPFVRKALRVAWQRWLNELFKQRVGLMDFIAVLLPNLGGDGQLTQVLGALDRLENQRKVDDHSTMWSVLDVSQATARGTMYADGAAYAKEWEDALTASGGDTQKAIAALFTAAMLAAQANTSVDESKPPEGEHPAT